MKDIANPDVPIYPNFIIIKHPANDEPFLLLPANNVVQQAPANEPRTFGVHHLTVLTACQILTSHTGFLSLSSDRENAEGVASMDPDGILTLKEYYYHLTNPQTDPLYPICLDFSSWRFPHDQLPQAWDRTVSLDEDDIVARDNWSVISTAVKTRDRRCRLSGWCDGITTAHIIPNEEGSWMRLNNMDLYSLSNKKEPENDSRNLFALRSDLHSLLFDQAKWVVVPKGGQMVVHFIDRSYEAAALYHNQTFDTAQLSHEFLFARFAWAIIEQAKSVIKPSLRKRFRLIIPTSESPVNEPQAESAQGSVGTNQKEPIKKKRKTMDAAPLDVNDSQVNEVQELQEDLRLAERIAPFFFEEPDLRRDRYHTMMWYPGKSIVERRKREYMDTHPNIRSRSMACPSLSSDNSDSEGEDC
ncbi:hypothetical protein BYT27DRAFT_7180892 [Phlegmacium glaucopus]|nr:hypothetical protein BYT27DRAFT_7180892 [Phlegmacium glaucopus]